MAAIAPLQSSNARKWKVDVSVSSIWTPVRGIAECKWNPYQPTVVDDNVYESEGRKGATKTELAAVAELKLIRKRTAGTTTYDPGQEALRTAGATLGDDGVAYVRIYDREGGSEAYEMYCEVEWSADGGSTSDTEKITVTLTDKATLAEIENPEASSGS
jgi:hypothetical protein